jgi:hypothetical protein
MRMIVIPGDVGLLERIAPLDEIVIRGVDLENLAGL